MLIHLNPNSGLPIYRQLFGQLRQRIVSGQLAREEQLPSVRDLAAELKINLLTVAKVYQLLEAEGFVETRRGLGTFVIGGRESHSQNEKRKLIADAIEQVVTEAHHLDLEESELMKLIHQKFAETKRRP